MEAWLRTRLDSVPASLRERILEAARREAFNPQGEVHAQQPDASRSLLHDQLRRLGECLLAEAKSAPASRETALTLLAADALITFACEAIAERDPGALGKLR